MMDNLPSVAVWYNGVQQLSYHSLDPPMQTNDEFQALITAANAGGIFFISRKGKEVSSKTRALLPSASSEYNGTEIGEGTTQLALMVGIQCADGKQMHIIIPVKQRKITTGLLPSSPLYLYQSLRNSQDLGSARINSHIDTIDPCKIYLVTARMPLLMNDPNFGHLLTGLKQLGLLEELGPGHLIQPTIDCEERTALMQAHELDNALELFVLYIFTGVSLKVDY